MISREAPTLRASTLGAPTSFTRRSFAKAARSASALFICRSEDRRSQDFKENDFNLNIPRYVDTFEEEEEIDLKAVQEEIEQLKGELSEVRKKMGGYLKELGL